MQAISYTIRHYEASYLGDFFTRAQNIIILRTKIASTYPLNEHILEKSVNGRFPYTKFGVSCNTHEWFHE